MAGGPGLVGGGWRQMTAGGGWQAAAVGGASTFVVGAGGHFISALEGVSEIDNLPVSNQNAHPDIAICKTRGITKRIL